MYFNNLESPIQQKVIFNSELIPVFAQTSLLVKGSLHNCKEGWLWLIVPIKQKRVAYATPDRPVVEPRCLVVNAPEGNSGDSVPMLKQHREELCVAVR
jgi:hypothetical protein